LGTKTDQRR